jgi:hypothetical protein
LDDLATAENKNSKALLGAFQKKVLELEKEVRSVVRDDRVRL